MTEELACILDLEVQEVLFFLAEDHRTLRPGNDNLLP
jgi:hypothetical protein